MLVKKGIVIISILLFATFAFAQDSNAKKVEITYTSDDNIRDIAQKYLGDPNLWQEILYSSKLSSAKDLKDGVVLTIYPQKILNTNKKKLEAKANIEEATKAGARVFATLLINNAINELDNGLKSRQDGNWDKAFQQFTKSLELSDAAIEKVNKERVVDSEALISFRKGKVEKKESRKRVWYNAPVKTKLMTDDRARTLSDSYAEISFADDSKIRLNENSLAVIKKSRHDLLNHKKENSVKLVKGDAFALFSKNSKKKNELEIPGVKVNVKSSFFWVEKKDKSTKFANYNGELEVTSQDSTVNLAENQGAVIPENGVPSAPINLLAPPEISSPENSSKIYDDQFQIKWAAIDNAVQYYLIISKDANRQQVVRNERNVKTTSINVEHLEPGAYYCFVSSIDKYGFPGKMSSGVSFSVIKDEEAPFLVVKSPANNLITKTETIDFEIETEPGLTVDVNGDKLEFEGNTVSKSYKLENGSNEFVVTAVDNAGNKTVVIREVYFEKSGEIAIVFDESLRKQGKNKFLTSSNSFTLSGKTRPEARLELTDNAAVRLSTYSNDDGVFRFLIGNISNTGNYQLKVVTPAGHEYTEQLTIVRDISKPEINFANSIPEKTNQTSITVDGTLIGADKLILNGTELNLSNNTFTTIFNLNYGENKLDFRTEDQAGNKSGITKFIFMDNRPPELVKYDINKTNAKNVVTFDITLNVKDDSQLRKVAKVKIFTGSMVINKFLNLADKEGKYKGALKIPAQNAGQSVGFEVELSDYPGNSKVYKLR